MFDATHPNALEQAECCVQVLKELEAEDRRMLVVLNKADRQKTASEVLKLLQEMFA